MSWGIRITILYVAFMAMILFLVFKTMNEKVDLVSADYYQKELKFQDQIDRQNETVLLSEQPKVSVTEKLVSIKFPAIVVNKNVSGSIKFYRPSDSSKDFTADVSIDSLGIQSFNNDKFAKGIYQAQLTWSAEGKNYYNELSIYIP